MKSMLLILCTIFIIITFSWAGYVIYMGGTVDPGPAVISSAAVLCCSQALRFLNDKENKKIIASGVKTTAKVTSVKKCWWLKVNTKPVRAHSFDGAAFPHIIYFAYVVNNIEYTGKQFISYKSAPPNPGAEIEVYYDIKDPKNYVVK